MKKSSRIILAVAAAVTLVAGGGATAYAAHYQDHALPGSEVAGISVSGMDRATVAQTLKDKLASTKVTISAPDGETTVTPAELGETLDVDATVDKVFEANQSWSNYATALVSPTSVQPVVTSDSAALDAFTAGLLADQGVAPTSATVHLGEDQTSFTVTPAVGGRTLDTSGLGAAAAKAASTLTSGAATASVVDVEPDVSTAAAQGVADAANGLVALPVTVTGADKSFEASPAEKASWVQLPAAGATDAPTINQELVAAWVTGKADGLNRDAVKGTRNVSSSGAVLSVTKEAKDGLKVINAADVASAVAASLASGQTAVGALNTEAVKATWTDRVIAAGAENLAYAAADGEKWIDVNLSRKTMTAYVGSTAVIGPVAMVDGAGATPTVTGTFNVYLKYQVQTMRGQNADGSNYVSENVPWVTYFHRGYALHGAPWRSSFGYAGSHGCINLPVGVAKQVWDFAPIGTPVVVHR